MRSIYKIMAIAIASFSAASAQQGIIGAALRNEVDGVMITDVVDGMPADAAGLESGDLITKVDNQPVGNKEYLIAFIRSNPFRTIQITYLRDGDRYRTNVTIAQSQGAQANNASNGSVAARRQYILTQIRILESKISSQERSIELYKNSNSTGATHMMLMNSAYQLLQTYQTQRSQWVQMLNQL